MPDRVPSGPRIPRVWRVILARTGVLLIGTILFVAEPAIAQQNPVCSADRLAGMIEGFFQLTTGLGIVGLVVVWQADSLIEIFIFSMEQKKGFKPDIFG